MNHFFGVAEINIYACNVSQSTMRVLEYFKSRGMLSIFPMPPVREGKTWDGVSIGNPASITDCQWRNMYKYKYTLVLDIDEIIVPKATRNYSAMLQNVNKVKSLTRVKSYTFRNIYFWVGCEKNRTRENTTYMFRLVYLKDDFGKSLSAITTCRLKMPEQS